MGQIKNIKLHIVTDIKTLATARLHKQNGQTNKEGWNRRQVWNAIWCISKKDGQKIEVSQHAKYTCKFCGKDAMKRSAVGIWKCKSCRKTVAGGAWAPSTSAAVTVRSAIRRLREMQEI